MPLFMLSPGCFLFTTPAFKTLVMLVAFPLPPLGLGRRIKTQQLSVMNGVILFFFLHLFTFTLVMDASACILLLVLLVSSKSHSLILTLIILLMTGNT